MSLYELIYGFTLVKMKALQKEADKNLANRFIKPLTFLAGALILVVQRKDGGLCLCMDYKELNQITVKPLHFAPYREANQQV